MTDVDLASARENMVGQQLRTWEVLNERVLDILERIPREHFTPSAYANLAYADMQIPLGEGEVMLEPKVEGRLMQALDPHPHERVLEIGTGSGYLAACLAQMASHVTSVELHPAFSENAQKTLDREGVRNVHLETGDAARGWDDGRQYDVIAVTGSLPELHEGFHRALTPGGRLFVIHGKPPIMEALLITRVGEDQWSRESLFDTSAPPLVGAPVTRTFSL
ncbi:protein-L-isoaspartate O-methyltransferase family protein [Spiribacter salinus]|jgi:protein-L-isoaspartate(D-aspartate) O-methyltransferase|uniref:Protein-L-isoaspartate O-methyltransferase n=1 Tax=Spiribacter salinus TaxID=1335746 RepID=A0A540VR58_9GAMM|nr:protein-L-isoaspartate O-methyltransferase [Spiribacter salinus]MBY5268526.1 protein-L-isoaspartate O-methyltransferase [Spiribacter salinus]MDR9413971.1 protein-L-isoaspartate O-methyltransferase [Spiribacter sp.]MDR9455575.1 protein-L-isoaspartate O-methyltransferase [Spiribacter sp.]TQE99251.1 MAG: protein-L-isoaspartate O-methyltransferase [Spiribacter salinus]